MISVLIVATFVSLVSSLPVHNGMLFYQMPAYYSVPRSPAYRQAMFVHLAPHSVAHTAGAGTSAFASGDTVAAGTYHRESKVQHRPDSFAPAVYDNSEDVHAIAEAYPEEPLEYDGEVAQRQEERINEIVPPSDSIAVPEQPAVLNQHGSEEATTIGHREEPTTVVELVPTTQTPLAPLPVLPITPAVATPKRKVHVEVDIPSDDDENESDEEDVFPFVNRPKKPAKSDGAAYPPYTFFPVNFGRTSGGAIAVANAFSTGKGAARSHAIAYGSPASRRLKATKRYTSDK